MKKILITGANSYIGTSFEKYMTEYHDYSVETLDMLDKSWGDRDFSQYDVVFHVAGIAHSDVKKPTQDIIDKYYAVNTNLTVNAAKKAKHDGVRQFIFMSSMIVFGSKSDCITSETKPNPDNFYGNSKLRADNEIQKLNDSNFKVVSLRPPMIYGKGSKGNYPLLAKFAQKFPIFPNIENKRSMLYIENLCAFVKTIVDDEASGYFYPQNSEYVCTSELVKCIANAHGKRIVLTSFFNPMIKLIKNHPIIKKVFGDSYYAKEMSVYKKNYQVVDFEESIDRTER